MLNVVRDYFFDAEWNNKVLQSRCNVELRNENDKLKKAVKI